MTAERVLDGRVCAAANGIDFRLRTAVIWDAMYEDCRAAKTSIDFEQYIIRDDAAGHRFLELFAAKAAEGVRIRILADMVGSRGLGSSPLIAKIRARGGEVRFYNSIGPLNVLLPFSWFPRDHSKVMVIDGEIVHIGSACMAAHMRDWRDTQARLTGPIVKGIARDFDQVWLYGRRLRNAPYRADPGQGIRYVSTLPKIRRSRIYRELLGEIRRARESVFLITPYFLPPWHLRRALRLAAKRGIDVRVMLGERTDVPLADYVSHSYLSRLAGQGIRIFLYGAAILHTKYAIVDGRWATLGSTNMDYLSLLRNREANLIVRDGAVVAALRGHFDADLRECREIGSGYYRELPWRYRLAGHAGRILRRVL